MCFYSEGTHLHHARRFPQVVVSHQQHQTEKINKGPSEISEELLQRPHGLSVNTPWWDSKATALLNALIFISPGLLDDVIGPHQAAHVPGAVVAASEGLEGARNGVGQHQDEGRHPGGSDDLGGVRFSLPRPGGQRVANGAVALQGDGHQVEGGHTY